MDPGIIVIILALVLLLFRVPVYIALAFPSILYVLLFDIRLTIISQRMVRSLDSFPLLAVPLFVLVGTLMNESGISDNIFEFADHIVGHISGGLAQVNIMVSLIFSGISGSAIADVGGIGRIMIENMHEHGYSRGYAAAVTTASATLGPIFPPSIILIIYGALAEVSILQLLLAGVVPAIVTFALLMIGTAIITRKKDIPTTPPPSKTVIGKSFLYNFAALATPFVLIAGLMSGLFGVTEAAAITVFYILLVNIIIYQNRDWGHIWTSCKETVYTTSVILIILASAALFSWVLTVERTADVVAVMMFSISENPLVLLLLLNVILIVLGLVLEPISALLISIPLFVPPLVEVGVDPVHLGIIMVFNLMIGLLTPPVGLTLFVASDVGDVPVPEIISELLPYYVILIVSLLLITFIPELSLFFPQLAL